MNLIPRITVDVVDDDPTPQVGAAGVVGILGNFEQANSTTIYDAPTERDAKILLGRDKAYSGTECIEQLFKKTSISSGVERIVAYQLGERTGAKTILKSVASEDPITEPPEEPGNESTEENNGPKDLIELEASGGNWGKNLKVTVTDASFKPDTYKIIITLNDELLISFNNITLISFITRLNNSKVNITARSLVDEDDFKLEKVVDQEFSGGTESNDFTIQDIITALDNLKEEKFNLLVFSEEIDVDFYPAIEEALTNKFKNDKPTNTLLSLPESDNVQEAVAIMNNTPSGNISFNYQRYNELGIHASTARIAGFVAGLNVNISPGNKVIDDIYRVTPELSPDEMEMLLDAGAMVLKMKDRQANSYKIVNAFTATQRRDKKGEKIVTSSLYAKRKQNYIIDFFDLEDWLGRTDIDHNVTTAKGEIKSREKILLDKKIVKDITTTVTWVDGYLKIFFDAVISKEVGEIKKLIRIKAE